MARDFPNNAANYLAVGDVPGIDITGDRLTISAWIYADSLSASNTILSKRNDASNQIQYEFFVNSSGQVGAMVGNGGSTFDIMNGGTEIVTNKWIHCAMVKKGAAVTDALTTWANGRMVATNAGGVIIGHSPQPLHFGKISGVTGSGNPFDGRLAHIAIWDAALDAIEISELSQQVSPLSIRPGSLRGYWPLNDYSVAKDLSRFASHATMVGTVPIVVDRISFIRHRAITYYPVQASDIPTYTDVATVYLNLTADGSDIYEPGCFIIGDGEATLRWSAGDQQLRWLGYDANLRWDANVIIGTAHC